MRVIAKFSLLFVLVLAVFLVVRIGSRILSTAKAGHRDEVQQEQRNLTKRPEPPRVQPETNSAAEPTEGFYVGKGNQRVYVNYATPDPLLRSFIASVMDGSSDPNTKGKQIFLKLCAVCHQNGGEGKDGVAPPLVGSEWALTPGGGRLVRIVLNGMSGPVRVRGMNWNLSMPPWRENLNDDQVAVVLTFVRTQLGNNHAGPISPEFVAAVRKETHATLETAEELLRISAP